eukprot:scpid111037/ scgid27210/ 
MASRRLLRSRLQTWKPFSKATKSSENSNDLQLMFAGRPIRHTSRLPVLHRNETPANKLALPGETNPLIVNSTTLSTVTMQRPIMQQIETCHCSFIKLSTTVVPREGPADTNTPPSRTK